MDFTKQDSGKDLICFLIPLIAAELFQQVYALINTIVVSHVLDYRAVAVIGACSGFLAVRSNFICGMMYGFGIYLGKAVGRNDEDYFRQSFSALAVCTLMLGVLGIAALPFTYRMLLAGNVPAELFDDAGRYLRTAFAGSGAMTAKLFLLVTLQAVGETGYFSFLAAAWQDLMKNGFSKTAYFVLGAAGDLFLQRTVNTFPVEMIAGQTWAVRLQTVLLVLPGELGTASGVITGQNVGAGNRENIRRYHRRLVRWMVWYGLMAIGVVYLMGYPLLRILTGTNQTAVAVSAADWIRITVSAFPAAFFILYRNALQAMGRYVQVVCLGILHLAVMLVTAYVLAPAFGYEAAAFGVAAGWMLQTAAGVFFFRHAMKGGAAVWKKKD
ncbi:MAG: MATE family efflux transporter [Lachnospiraceae bacterium]|nr:MATE family efflux transporter [Lachnospiraceae bacterium]